VSIRKSYAGTDPPPALAGRDTLIDIPSFNLYNLSKTTDEIAMKVTYKIWLDNDGKAFGEGPYRLLKQIEKTGSLHQAAMDLSISYRKAWVTLHTMEERLGFVLVDRKVGGHSGGGSHITDPGQEFIRRYEEFRDEAKAAIETIYEKHFPPNSLTHAPVILRKATED
jgi:molybdate transport system regulatory protein